MNDGFGHLLVPGNVVGESGVEDAVPPHLANQDGEEWRNACGPVVAFPAHRQTSRYESVSVASGKISRGLTQGYHQLHENEASK